MELGNKIKRLRYKMGITQEQLAERLGVSPQSVSKWENAVSMPDITLLPGIAEAFGVSIDELFDLTVEQKLRRVESCLDAEPELSGEQFLEYEKLLTEQLSSTADKARIYGLLGQLYHHRMESDARKVSRYAREAMKMEPGKKECQWLLQKAENAVIWDWNTGNHTGVIDFYKELVQKDPAEPLPYYHLLDNLIVDHRVNEAEEYLSSLQALPGHSAFLVPVYRASIALAAYDEKKADGILQEAMKTYSKNGGFLFEAAQYYARKCDYEKAVEYYESSYACEESQKPRFTDALQGIAVIYEILGQYQKAAETYDRILDNLKNEWGFTEEAPVQEAVRERTRLLQKSKASD